MQTKLTVVDPLESRLPVVGNNICFPSYPISGTDSSSISGLGTKREPDCEQLIALRIGYREKSNTFTYIRPLTEFYEPQIGDVVLGRVQQILPSKWLLDIRAIKPAHLKLDSLNLPGLLRQRQTSDETNMKLFLGQNELVVVEMRANNQVFTRNHAFGKLSHGQVLWISPRLLTGTNHFVNIDQLSVILGKNGGIWVSNLRIEQESAIHDQSVQEYTETSLRLLGQIVQFIQELAGRNASITASILQEEFRGRGHTVQVL